MNTIDAGRRYMERWFWSLDQLIESVGATQDAVLELIGAGCVPGPIYVLADDRTWWSALDNATPTPVGRSWYSPGAAWGLRRGLVAVRSGASAVAAVAAERTRFIFDFVTELAAIEDAGRAFPGCLAAGAVDQSLAKAQAAKEWESWVRGGYGVCLRIFTARTCIAKEALRASLLEGLKQGRAADEMLRLAEALAGLILPFAPWQRASGTPGQTIDRLLEHLSLGRELAYE